MGSLLVTVLLAVPLITWLSGIILLTDSEWKLARSPRAPRGRFPISQKSNSPAIATRSVFEAGRSAVDEVSR
jgi:hypothetical protein